METTAETVAGTTTETINTQTSTVTPNTQTGATISSKTDAIIKDLRINPEWLITLLLAFFLGVIGVHRFYNGKTGTGILMILTLGGLGIWLTIDIIMIAFGKFTRKDGTLVSVRIPAN